MIQGALYYSFQRTNKISPWENTKKCFVPTSNEFTSDLKVLSIWIKYSFHICYYKINQVFDSKEYFTLHSVVVVWYSIPRWLYSETDYNLIIHSWEIEKPLVPTQYFTFLKIVVNYLYNWTQIYLYLYLSAQWCMLSVALYVADFWGRMH